MPQPLPIGKTSSFGPNSILERPELAAQIGNVCANWTLVENAMMSLYGLLMGMYLPKHNVPGFEWMPPTHPVAYQVFDALNALAPRLDLLLRLCRWKALPEEAEYLERTLAPIVRKRFSERSIIAHGLWGICDEYQDALILQRTFGGNQIWQKSDFEQTSERILELLKQMHGLMGAIYERLRQ